MDCGIILRKNKYSDSKSLRDVKVMEDDTFWRE